MKKKLIIIVLFTSIFSYSQNFKFVDSIVKLYPNKISKIDDLVSKINVDFKSDENKARAVFYWISNNIKYDVEFSNLLKTKDVNTFSYKNENERIKKENLFILDLANKTINSNNAVCHGYSALFEVICNKLKLECKLIIGDLKSNINQIGINFEVNHAWNALKINNSWQLVDCTLAAGNISNKTNKFEQKFNDSFFFTNPEIFGLNHYPEDKKWTLTNLSREEFLEFPIYFPEYFKENYKMKSLKNGSLSSKNYSLSIIFENPDIINNVVEYYFMKDKKFMFIENIESTLNYVIPFDGKSNDTILLYINSKPIIGYKLK